MNEGFRLFVNPGGFTLEQLPRDPQSITIHKAGGEIITLDPQQAQVKLTGEHPQVERMEGDWGAICEVFRKSNTYYVSVNGVVLGPGDSITLSYSGEPGMVALKVIEIENGRARIEPPEISAFGGRQSP